MQNKIINTNSFLTSTLLSRRGGPAALVLAGLMVAATPAFADDMDVPVTEVPQVAGVASGEATFDYSVPAELTVNQSSQNVVIDFDTYNIGEEATTEYVQPNSTSLAVNRVKDSNPSKIRGKLKANGQVVILNQNGVFFGPKSQVDVAGLVVSTGTLDQDEFTNNNNIRLTNIDTGGTVRNDGAINIREAGVAAFVAPNVINNGVIEAKLGKVALASGSNAATVDLFGDGLVSLALDQSTSHALIENAGTIRANGGKIAITAQAAADAVDSLVNIGGAVEASSVTSAGGVIRLGGNAKVKITGKLDASGATGGGTISVEGKSIETSTDALVMADAYITGNGGNVRFFAGDDAVYQGQFYARGGFDGGNGGQVELSAADLVGYNGSVDTSALNGQAGSFLIDPLFAVIHSGWLNNPFGLEYVLSAQALANDIAKNGSVTVQADNYIDVGTDVLFPGVGNGDIDLAHYNYTTLDIVGYTRIGPFNFPIFALVNHSGITSGAITLDTDVVNFNKDVLLGTGGMNILANTVNLNSVLSTTDGITTALIDQGDILGSTASIVNVLSDDAKIQQGIYLADDAATVNVAAGTYLESVNVAKSVTLNGANMGVAGNGLRGAESIIDPNSPGLYITADNVTVDGFFITGAEDGILVDGANNTWLKNNLITGNTKNGINLKNSQNTQIDHNYIHHNTRNGIELFNSQFTNIHHNLIDFAGLDGIFSTSNQNLIVANNTVTNSHDDGIDVEGTLGNVQIINNTVNVTGVGFAVGDNESNGIELSGGKNAVVSGNTVTNAMWDGIYVDQSKGTQVTNNTVTDVIGNHGINVAKKNVDTTVSDNTIARTRRYGVNIFDSTNTTVEDNNISQTTLDGIHSSSAKDVFIIGNTLTNIREDGIDVEGTSGIINISSNDINGTGVGLVGDLGNGIELSDGKNALIALNQVRNSAWDGIYIDRSTDTFILSNLVDGTVQNHGIDVYTKNVGTTVVGNTVLNTRRYGVNVFDSLDTTIAGNTISLTKLDGIHSSSNKNVWIDGNVLTDIREDGIDVEGTSGVVEITDNTVHNAGYTLPLAADQANGIELSGGKNVLIKGNKVYNSQWSGIYIDQADGTLVTENYVDGTIGYHGIDVNTLSKNTVVDNNEVTNTRRYGVNIFNATDTHILNNLISLTRLDGIHSSSNKNVWIDGNNLTDLGEDGIDVEGTSGIIEITNNTVNNVGVGLIADQGNGIELSNGKNALIDGNIVNNVQHSGIWIDGSKGTTISNNDITGATVSGLSLMGYQNDLGGMTTTTLLDNTFVSLLDGATFQSGNIDFQGVNTFDFTRDGLVFAPDLSKPAPYLQVVGDTFGTTVLNDADTLGYFINLYNGAMFGPGNPTILDARFVTFNDGATFVNYVPGAFTLPFATWSALEDRLHDYDDTGVDGQIFFQPDQVPTFSILGADINDILDEEEPQEFNQEGGSVTILGLPFARIAQGGLTNPEQNLANIEPAAGGNAEEVANIEPAAGGSGDQAGCWDQVYSHFSNANSPITFSINGTPMGLLGSQANCQSTTGNAGL